MQAKLFGTVGIAGIGLIGGSLARDIRTFGLADRIIGWNRTPRHAERALELGLIDSATDSLDALTEQAELIVLAFPVNVLVETLPALLAKARPEQIFIDVGSTKTALAESVKDSPQRGRFVACHPMAGNERSGPDAAVDHLFQNRFTLIIDAEKSDLDALRKVQAMWSTVGSILAEMDAVEHDQTAAFLSHMPHVLAYALARSIRVAERDQVLNARFAGGGLASMTRIAHSPLSMWKPIFRQNREFLLEAIDDFQRNLAAFRNAIEADDEVALDDLMR